MINHLAIITHNSSTNSILLIQIISNILMVVTTVFSTINIKIALLIIKENNYPYNSNMAVSFLKALPLLNLMIN